MELPAGEPRPEAPLPRRRHPLLDDRYVRTSSGDVDADGNRISFESHRTERAVSYEVVNRRIELGLDLPFESIDGRPVFLGDLDYRNGGPSGGGNRLTVTEGYWGIAPGTIPSDRPPGFIAVPDEETMIRRGPIRFIGAAELPRTSRVGTCTLCSEYGCSQEVSERFPNERFTSSVSQGTIVCLLERGLTPPQDCPGSVGVSFARFGFRPPGGLDPPAGGFARAHAHAGPPLRPLVRVRPVGPLSLGALDMLRSESLGMLKTLAVTPLLTGVAVLFVFPSPAGAVAIDCSEVGAVAAAAWRHPTRPGLVAVLCRHDPLPGWSDSLWIVEAAPGAVPEIIEVPLHGTGVDSSTWLECPGPALAHVVDRTHMGTVTDQVLRVEPRGRVRVVEATRLPPGSGSARSHVACP